MRACTVPSPPVGSQRPLVDGRLIEAEAGAFLDVGDEAPGDVEVVVESDFKVGDFAIGFVDPDGALEFLRRIFRHAVGLGVLAADEVEDDGGAAAEHSRGGVRRRP